MNLGKTLFARSMAFVPWTSFARIMVGYSGGALISVLPGTVCGMSLRQAVRRSTLADANERARLKEIEVHAGSLGDGFVLSGG